MKGTISVNNIYYVYAYIRSKDSKTAKAGTPYYIGKGKDTRAWDKEHGVTVPKDKTKIVILEQNLTNVGSLSIERRMIRWWGRKDLGTGILHNRTDGGDGGTNYSPELRAIIGKAAKGRIYSAESRAKMSAAKKGKPKSAEHREKMKIARANLSDESRANIDRANKSKRLTQETKDRISASVKSTIQAARLKIGS